MDFNFDMDIWILLVVVAACIVAIGFYILLGPPPRYPGERG